MLNEQPPGRPEIRLQEVDSTMEVVLLVSVLLLEVHDRCDLGADALIETLEHESFGILSVDKDLSV